ncbi:MAG TPA: thioredoxin domain-containing protein [Blastocatellia bacterium]|nr:thioredoxin domain-containing protein [Blastocatellia bacterium]
MKRGLILFIMIALAAVAASAQSTSKRQARPKTSPAASSATKAAAPSEAANQKLAAKPAAKPADDCGCDGEALPPVLATVNGVKITTEEVDKEIKDEIDSLRKQVIDARRNELGLQVNSKLLEAEARRLAISTERLLQNEVVSKAKEPGETEIKIYYDDNKERIQAEYADAKPHIARFLLGQRQQAEAKKLADRLRAAADLKILVSEATPPKKQGDRERIFATVNGQSVSSGQIEDSIAPLIFSFQQRVHDMRQSRLESMINAMLLQQEAKKRKLTPATLLEVETSKRAKAITEQDAKRFYDENKSKITGDYEVLKDQVLSFVREQERRKGEAELAQRLRDSASVQVFLKTPEPPAFAFTNEDQPQKGNADAPVTLVEFTDFECPTCARAQTVLEEILAEYEGKVKLVVRDFPLEKHKNAIKAAEAAEGARAQGKYWEYVALMYKNQTTLDADNLKLYADQVGLDRGKFDSELDSGKYFDLVDRDRRDGLWLGVSGTPTLFVNGRRVPSITKDAVKTAIDAALKVWEESRRNPASEPASQEKPESR